VGWGGGGGGGHRSKARVAVLHVDVAFSQCRVHVSRKFIGTNNGQHLHTISRRLTGRAFGRWAGVPNFACFQLRYQRVGRCLCPARRVHDTSSCDWISIALCASPSRIRPNAEPKATLVKPTVAEARRALSASAVVVIGAALSLALHVDNARGQRTQTCARLGGWGGGGGSTPRVRSPSHSAQAPSAAPVEQEHTSTYLRC
jgi:hypothetical protein